MQKKYVQLTHRKDCLRCAGFLRAWEILLQSSRVASTQIAKKSSVESSFKRRYWYIEQQGNNKRIECLKSKVDNFHHQRKNPTANQSGALVFLFISSKEQTASDSKHVESKNQKIKTTTTNKKETIRIFCRPSKILWTNDTKFCYKNVSFVKNSKRDFRGEKTERLQKHKKWFLHESPCWALQQDEGSNSDNKTLRDSNTWNPLWGSSLRLDRIFPCGKKNLTSSEG